MDSVGAAVKGGASWADLVQKYNPQSDGSRAKNGEMTFSSFDMQQPNFAKEFAQFALFDGKKGEKKVVKTSFGYHLIEILELKNPEAHYKFTQFAKNIIASDETERVVLEDASKFVSESQDLKSFNDNIAKSNGRIQKFEAANIGPNDISIQDIDQRMAGGFGQAVSCRTLVREIYKADKGDVIKQERIGDAQSGYKYVVAAVTDILKEGTQPAYCRKGRIRQCTRC
jgi:peptidyl-prolyl cis-trans isomerase D